jgi:hypothetical protein
MGDRAINVSTGGRKVEGDWTGCTAAIPTDGIQSSLIGVRIHRAAFNEYGDLSPATTTG